MVKIPSAQIIKVNFSKVAYNISFQVVIPFVIVPFLLFMYIYVLYTISMTTHQKLAFISNMHNVQETQKSCFKTN